MAKAININLLKKRRGITESQYILEKKIFMWSVVVFVILVIVAIAFFVLQYLSTRKLSETEVEIRQVENQLSGLESINNSQLYLKNRLNLISGYFDSRYQDREALQRIFSIDLPGVAVLGASFESENTILIRVNSDNVISFDSLYRFFEEDETFFSQVINRGVGRTENGAYTMQIELTIPSGENT